MSQNQLLPGDGVSRSPFGTERGAQPAPALQHLHGVQGTVNAAVPPAAAAAPVHKAFGQLNDKDKANHLAHVMNDSAGTLKANGVSDNVEDLMAGVMMNEGGINTRRITMRNYFNKMMMGKNDQGGIAADLKKAGGLEKLRGDKEARAKFEKGMGEDGRFMMQQAFDGHLDIEGLTDDKNKDRKKDARAQLLERGIDLRTNQYDEMTSLMAQKKQGKLTKEQEARLGQLNEVKGEALGYDRYDQRQYDGAGTKKRDASLRETQGLSSGRFREIYEDSQTRFEVAHYDEWSKKYDKSDAEKPLAPGEQRKPITLGSGIGNHTLTDKDLGSLKNNKDLFADITTSYGAPQIMGLYGHNGGMKVKDAAGDPINFSLDKLKAAGRRDTPNEEEVQLLLGELGMKGTNVGSKTMSTADMTSTFNGKKGRNPNWDKYHNRLNKNVPLYRSAEKEVDAAAKAKQSVHKHLED